MEIFSRLFDQLSTFTTIFLGIFIEAAPFLLLGTLESGFVEVFFDKDSLARIIPRNVIGGAIVGSLLGLFFPVCECGVVPLTRRLMKKGMPLSVGVTFLMAAPAFNPIVIASTAAAFGVGRVLFLRMILTAIIAIITGLVFSMQKNPQELLLPLEMDIHEETQIVAPLMERVRQALIIAVDEFFEMGRYLIFGIVIAAGMQTLVPQAWMLSVASGSVISVLALMALAIVLSICSTVDAFIALSFVGTFTTGSILAFLVFGPMVDIKSAIMFMGVFRKRGVTYLVLLPFVLTLLATVFINLNTSW
ncbi:MAG: permease [Chloroflexi bacterium]|nr:permease [Chloroflexota bacterium]